MSELAFLAKSGLYSIGHSAERRFVRVEGVWGWNLVVVVEAILRPLPRFTSYKLNHQTHLTESCCARISVVFACSNRSWNFLIFSAFFTAFKAVQLRANGLAEAKPGIRLFAMKVRACTCWSHSSRAWNNTVSCAVRGSS